MASERVSWRVRSTSPLQFVAAFVGAALLQDAFALPLPHGAALEALHLTGTLLANAGLALALWCVSLFLMQRTTILPAHMPAQLIVRGPYRLTRNPFYVALLLSYAGLALILDVPWALATGLLPTRVLVRTIVPFEEAQLEARFGAAYVDYRVAVPRWF